MLAFLGLIALSALVAGCSWGGSERSHGYNVLNFSADTYVVRMTYANGVTEDTSVPPRSNLYAVSVSDPARAIVFDATCSTQIAAVNMSDDLAYLLIDEEGGVSVQRSAAAAGSPPLKGTSGGPIPASCY